MISSHNNLTIIKRILTFFLRPYKMSDETTRNNKKEWSKKTKKTFKLLFDNEKEICMDDVVRDTDECF